MIYAFLAALVWPLSSFLDLETRSGMRRIHAQFDEIQPRLEEAYNKYGDNEKVVGGIVGIWAKMSMDSLLRDKLVGAGEYSFPSRYPRGRLSCGDFGGDTFSGEGVPLVLSPNEPESPLSTGKPILLISTSGHTTLTILSHISPQA